jgi:hypothetical protein
LTTLQMKGYATHTLIRKKMRHNFQLRIEHEHGSTSWWVYILVLFPSVRRCISASSLLPVQELS